jgi:hypothetical protein
LSIFTAKLLPNGSYRHRLITAREPRAKREEAKKIGRGAKLSLFPNPCFS